MVEKSNKGKKPAAKQDEKTENKVPSKENEANTEAQAEPAEGKPDI